MPRGFEEIHGVADVLGVAFLKEKVLEVDNGVGAPVLLSPRWWRCSYAVHLRFDLGVFVVGHDGARGALHLVVLDLRAKDPIGRCRCSLGKQAGLASSVRKAVHACQSTA